jgi:hypothetical protein
MNSFTTIQNQILSALEKITGEKFAVEYAETKELERIGLDILQNPRKAREKKGPYKNLMAETTVTAIYGNGGFNNFSKTRGLWNERLGLPVEHMEESLKTVVAVLGREK